MTKYKVKIKDNHLLITAKLSKEDVINTPELSFLTNNYIRGILKPVQKRARKIEYSGPAASALSVRLKRPISKYEFFLIAEQFLDISERVKKKNLFVNKIEFTLDKIYINETTKELQFLYLPLTVVRAGADMMNFFLNYAYSVTPAAEADRDYVSRFVFFLNSLQKYDPKIIEAYIGKEDRAAVEAIKSQNVSYSGYMTDKRKDYYEHYESKNSEDDEDTGLLSDEEDTGLLDEGDEATGLLDENADEATGVMDDENATALLVENPIHYPSLLRVLTDESISVNKPVFRIGKEKSYVDCFVSNNNAVSRSHADIVTRGNRYFIVDLNSKNRTYVNGAPIPVQYEIEIFNNDRIKLANEEFIFVV